MVLLMICDDYVIFPFSSKYCAPHLKKGKNPHILNISPPLNMKPRWFKEHVGKIPYTVLGVKLAHIPGNMIPDPN